ncbi:hypothetical protein [Bradyrhizobium cenepequi]|uniref:hypothetical protein n=1 Tax=Bradyrhizobium cenepequi TaxID=2821403 RepID=UPI001CE271FE|nr:hypothetical protein [Bradyrhizobium cenepequi]MCA6110819.1 hypothetical protein [Bradyrhizobium cenepequi]
MIILSELVFSALFMMFVTTCTLIAFLPMEAHLRAMHVIVALFDKLVFRSFPRCEDGQTASQQELIDSVRGQPAVRLAS